MPDESATLADQVAALAQCVTELGEHVLRLTARVQALEAASAPRLQPGPAGAFRRQA